jgi:hypothetical protein
MPTNCLSRIDWPAADCWQASLLGMLTPHMLILHTRTSGLVTKKLGEALDRLLDECTSRYDVQVDTFGHCSLDIVITLGMHVEVAALARFHRIDAASHSPSAPVRVTAMLSVRARAGSLVGP